MRAIVRHRYGPVQAVGLQEVPEPALRPKDVLVRVRAVSLNTSDVEAATGSPFYVRIYGLARPRFSILGTDVAGVVEAVGEQVSQFQVGDEVVGDMLGHGGALAELAAVPQSVLVKKPIGLSFEEASCFPQAGVIAHQGIEGLEGSGSEGGGSEGSGSQGRVQQPRVLINGAGGGSGTFAIQLAKLLGAEVTAVDNALKQEMMRALGADHVVDYQSEDFTRRGQTYDLILDLAGFRPVRDYARIVAPGGIYRLVGGSMSCLLGALALGPLHSTPLLAKKRRRLGVLAVKPNVGLSQLMERSVAGEIKPVIDRTFALADAPFALSEVAQGRALGKLVIRI